MNQLNTKPAFALVPIHWEYNDETYQSEGYDGPEAIFFDKAKADAACRTANGKAYVDVGEDLGGYGGYDFDEVFGNGTASDVDDLNMQLKHVIGDKYSPIDEDLCGLNIPAGLTDEQYGKIFDIMGIVMYEVTCTDVVMYEVTCTDVVVDE